MILYFKCIIFFSKK